MMRTYLTLAICLMGWACQPPKSEAPVPLKHVVVIIGDDHVASTVGIYGNPAIATPHLDRIARQGVYFTRAFANAPLCSASRQSLLTGKYPHATGVTLLRTPFSDDNYTLAEHLRGRGFATGVLGKTHFNNYGPEAPDHGFSTTYTRGDYQEALAARGPRPVPDTIGVKPPWKPFRDPARVWLNADRLPMGKYDADMEATFLVGEAKQFISRNRDGRFCLFMGFHEPHSPFDFPVDVARTYRPEEMPLPPVSPEDDRWVPEIFRDLSEADQRGIIASYYTSVSYLDQKVGEVYDHLDSLGLADETLFIYIGDQGYLLGDHKRFEKHMMWDPANHAPLILRAGNRYAGGTALDVLTEFVDLAPTILDLLGMPPLPESQGKSLLPVLEGTDSTHKTQVFSEFLVDHKAMVRTRDWKYIYTTGDYDLGQGYATGFGPSGVSHRLYHLSADPYEHRDVAQDPAHQERLQQMQQELLDWFIRTDPRADTLPPGLTIAQQLAWFCIPPEGDEPKRDQG